MTNRTLIGLAALMLVSTTALAPLRAADMTFERALNADKEPQNWLLHHKNYQGHRFSQLKEIDTTTVANLKLAFTVGLGGMEAGVKHVNGNLEATPLVDDGIMYITDGWGSVYAIDVTGGKKGVIRWKFNPEVDRVWAGDVACCGVNNRGVALWKDKIISAALDGRLFALNRATGEKIWERKVADPAIGESVTLAPLVVRDLGIIGSAGGEYGIRGWIDATDLNTGKQAWRTFTIPGKGEPGNETWKDGHDRWQHGGGSIWVTATYDKDTDRATTSGRQACSRSIPAAARSSGASSTRPMILTTMTRFPSTRSSTLSSTARIASSSCTVRATASSTSSTGPTAPSWPASNMSTS
jgi:alcohol dehydrogenase (cytochrome c)